MPLIDIVIALTVVGLPLYLINCFIPMASSIKAILNVILVAALSVWVLQTTGLWGPYQQSPAHSTGGNGSNDHE
jgi:hypothetical protein